MTEGQIEAWEERAAIIEFESGEHISRLASEVLAANYLKMTADELREAREIVRVRSAV